MHENIRVPPLGLNLFQGLIVQGVIKMTLLVMLMPSLSHRVTFGHIEGFLAIGVILP